LALQSLTRDLAGGKEAVGHHQKGNQPKKKDGVGRVAFAELRWHGISRGPEDKSTDCGNRHAEEDDGRSVVRNDVVDLAGPPGKAGHHEILGDADDQQRESPSRQEKESCEYQNMESTRELIARVFPLPEPELEDPSEARTWPIKTWITLGANERHHSLRDNVKETTDSENMDGKK
jgi:hypothetical protein